MSPTLVALCYGSAIVVSLLVLWRFGAIRWYWHLLAVVLALAIGLLPMSGFWNTPAGTLLVGWAFLFLVLWGLAAPLFGHKSHPLHLHFRHH